MQLLGRIKIQAYLVDLNNLEYNLHRLIVDTSCKNSCRRSREVELTVLVAVKEDLYFIVLKFILRIITYSITDDSIKYFSYIADSKCRGLSIFISYYCLIIYLFRNDVKSPLIFLFI